VVTTYVDSSALVPVYVTERFSKAARAAVRRASQIPSTPLHELEVPNAFEMLVARGAITRDECRAILEQLREDVDAQRLMTVSPDLEAGVRPRKRVLKPLHGEDTRSQPGPASRGSGLSHHAHALSQVTIVSLPLRKPAVSK
jgi:hypothetical protein